MSESLVEVRISDAVRVSDFIEEHGFVCGSKFGEVGRPGPSENIVGILREPPPVKGFWKRLTSSRSRTFIATIRLYGSSTYDTSRWNISVFGRQNVELLEVIAEGLAERFKKPITVDLGDEAERGEHIEAPLDSCTF